jgi:hypothetical protein
MDADAQRAHELFVACPPESRADLLINLLQSTTAQGALAALFGAYDEPDLRHRLEPHGTVDIKGKGPMETFILLGRC